MIEMTRMAWPRWIVMSALCACGGDDGGGTAGGTEGGTEGGTAGGTADGTADGSDESGGDLPPPGSDRDPNGDQCGGDVNGWQTTCLVDSVTAATSDMGPILGAPPVGASTGRFLCCEGRPTIETADHGCDGICQLEVCEAAKLAHMNRCESCGPFDCGFDMSNCLAGSPHDQLVLCAMPIQLPFSYTLTANCEASNNEVRNPDGSFHFLDQPVNDPMNDPPFCMPSSELGLDPPAGLGQFAGSASTGTKARVTWSLADADGEQQSEALDADFEYALVPCAGPAGECLQITSLLLTLPTTEALELCAQCHGLQWTDFQHGAHGGMRGAWDLNAGPRERNHCVDCHDPHRPAFGQYRPMPPPRDRFVPTPPHRAHSEHGAQSPSRAEHRTRDVDQDSMEVTP